MTKTMGWCGALLLASAAFGQTSTVVRAARLLDVESGKMLTPGEVLVTGERIVEVGTKVAHPAGAEVIDLGDRTLLPGLIDAHVHLFLHPGAEDLQTVQESVPQRTILALLAAKADLMGGFTAERDMGTEGAGSADTAVRNAINQGLVPGPRLRISGNAVDILGGHEDAINFNPAQHVLPNATWANNAAELVTVIREQFKEGADFIKIYETGAIRFTTAFSRRRFNIRRPSCGRRWRRRRGWASASGCMPRASREHFTRRGRELPRSTMRYSSVRDHAADAGEGDLRGADVHDFRVLRRPCGVAAAEKNEREMIAYHAQQFRRQLAAGVPVAMGSDVGPFPHGTQAREFVLMAKYGLSPLASIQAGTVNAAKLLGWGDEIGTIKARLFRGHGGGAGKSAGGYRRPAARGVRDEGRRGVQEVGLLAEGEVDVDLSDDLDGIAVEQGGFILPLADGVEGGGGEERIAADYFEVGDFAGFVDGGL